MKTTAFLSFGLFIIILFASCSKQEDDIGLQGSAVIDSHIDFSSNQSQNTNGVNTQFGDHEQTDGPIDE
ncbi:MAG: hypothetical protein AAFU57_00695 [Bacteroidota bacterium]